MLPCFKHAVLCGLLIILGMNNAMAETASGPLDREPRLRQLLQQEMQALQDAMGTISQALPQGQWHTVAETADQVHDSFIFQQKLTAEDRKTLHQMLPEGFIRQDKAFHQQAKKLQHAAESLDAELSLFYYSKMVESCITCHSQYATHRFPSLIEDTSGEENH